MGTKGRDSVFWLFVLFTAGAALAQSGFLYGLALMFAVLLAYYYLLYVPAAVRASRKMGLRTVVLLPVFFPWLYFNPHRIKGRWKRTWEVHVAREIDPKEFMPRLEADLLLIKSAVSGLFVWETSAPVPAGIRMLVRDLAKEGKAFWVKGKWPLPGAPLTKRELAGGRVRRGAILIEGEV
jgi:hypothetical protein